MTAKVATGVADPVAKMLAQAMAAPNDPSMHFALGNALWFAGQRDAAVASMRRCLALDPTHADAHNNLGNALVAMEKLPEAVAHYHAALASRPDHGETHYNLGNAYLAQGEQDAALGCYQRALSMKPGHAGAHNNAGNILRSQGRHAEALAYYQSALALRPDLYGTRNNIGAALLALHRPDAALAFLHEAVAQQPDYAEACNNLGGTYLALDRPEQALSWFRRAISLDAAHVQAQFGAALALLSLGRMAEGWRAYETRWLDPRFREDAPERGVPQWRGEPLDGRIILLHAEQGLGDTLQFCRYAPLVAARGGRVVLEVQRPLAPLLTGLADIVIAQGDAVPLIDLHCPLLSLPLACGTDLHSIPAAIPYLQADPARVAAWRARLGDMQPGSASRPRVGVAWSGSADHPDDALRSIPAAALLPPLLLSRPALHALQTDIRPEDAETLARLTDVYTHAPHLTDFAETAALVSLMDIVVSVDTSVAHLAAAMGKPVWLLVQPDADFRWLRNRTDSPWYPTLRLFRQGTPGFWQPVICAVADELARVLG